MRIYFVVFFVGNESIRVIFCLLQKGMQGDVLFDLFVLGQELYF
jgi:hypothetical protein